VWTVVLCEQLFCVNSCFVWTVVLCEQLFCVSSCFVWAVVLCEQLFCVNSCFVWTVVLCEQLFCVSSCFVWTVVLCEQLFCANSCFVRTVVLCEQLFCANSCFVRTVVLCEQLFSLMIRKMIFEISGWTDTYNDSSKNTNVKYEINKLSTNKRCQLLENILPINETSEQKSNGYCNVDFIFTLDQTKVSLICGIKVIFSALNLYLFLKCISSDLRSLCSLWFDMRSVCYLLCNNTHSDRSGKWHRKCKQ